MAVKINVRVPAGDRQLHKTLQECMPAFEWMLDVSLVIFYRKVELYA